MDASATGEIASNHSHLDDSPQLPLLHHLARSLAVGFVLVVPAVFALMYMDHLITADGDIWWHMRSAQWILAHHAFPHSDHFTSFGAGKPWAAYSWLYDLLLLESFNLYGLVGIFGYVIVMLTLMTAAIYHLIRRLQPDFWLALLITLVTSYCLLPLSTARPWLFSILFFIVQLDILFEVRKTGRTRGLYWLPLVYALWANLHIQFFDGLVVLGLAFGESVIALRWPQFQTGLKALSAGIALVACFLAAMINPYGWHIYKIGIDLATQPQVLSLITELQSMAFRSLQDFVLLFLALLAAAALSWQTARLAGRRFPLFETALLAFAAIVSFHTRRDIWVLLSVSAAILAQAIRRGHPRPAPLASRTGRILGFSLTCATALLLPLLIMRGLGLNNAKLESYLAQSMPVRAVQVCQLYHYRGPLYNDFSWGGYLMFNLRMPVSVDGRTDLAGTPHLVHSFANWMADPSWASDPSLQSAGLIIGPTDMPLVQVLLLDPRFQLAYRDSTAAVFVATRYHEPLATSYLVPAPPPQPSFTPAKP